MNKNLLVVGGGLLIFLLGAILLFGAPATQEPKQNTNPDGKSYGSGGPVNSANYTCNNGVCQGFTSSPLTATSSTICAQQNPMGATSTVQSVAVDITGNGIAGVQKYDISTSSNQFGNGTSTPAFIKNDSLSTLAYQTVSWTANGTTTGTSLIGSNPVTGENDIIVGPNEWVVMKVATGTPGTFASYYTGTCSTIWRALR